MAHNVAEPRGVTNQTNRRRFMALALMAASGAAVTAQYAMKRTEVVFPDKTTISVEVAQTDTERQRGLMFRKSLGDDQGMLFVFEEPGFYPFWMKNTLIPLDMLWLDAGGRVVSISEYVPPCKTEECPSYPPTSQSAIYVVEVNAGFVKKHGVTVGDLLEIRGLNKLSRSKRTLQPAGH
jgi:uncharacterized membrane protein (UPF0127 family)